MKQVLLSLKIRLAFTFTRIAKGTAWNVSPRHDMIIDSIQLIYVDIVYN